MSFFSALFGPDINEGVAEARSTGGAVLIDVRTPEEYASGHIEGACNVPVDAIGSISRTAADKQAPLYAYCASGARSTRACQMLARMGYASVKNIGGISRWNGDVVRGGR